jgi:hypothetical protein
MERNLESGISPAFAERIPNSQFLGSTLTIEYRASKYQKINSTFLESKMWENLVRVYGGCLDIKRR